LKYGLDQLMATDAGTISDNDLDQILCLHEPPTSGTEIENQEQEEMEGAGQDSIYFYEGKDYTEVQNFQCVFDFLAKQDIIFF
jgi:hypothetical protein